MDIISMQKADGASDGIYPVELKEIALAVAEDYDVVKSVIEKGTSSPDCLYVKLNDRQDDENIFSMGRQDVKKWGGLRSIHN